MKKLALSVLIGISLSLTAYAEDKNPAIEFRQSTFQVIKWNFANLAGMAKDKIPYDKVKAETYAKYLNNAAEMLKESFVPGSYQGSNAKPEVETKSAEFEKHYIGFVKETNAMLTAASDKQSLKKQVGNVGGTCKSCHDDFKKE